MTDCSEIADYEWLTSEAAAGVLSELASQNAPLHTSITRLRKSFSASRTHLLVEQVELRRRAGYKFRQPQLMFFTRVGLEQSTDEWVAGYKATRINKIVGRSSHLRVADLCCGIGGDLLALSAHVGAKGVDLDPIAAQLASANCRALQPENTIDVHCADASTFDLEGVSAWHIDPDRRPGGKRTTSLEWCEPSRDVVEQLWLRVPHSAVKLAPATDVPSEWRSRCELEWISRDRECRQLVAWHGDLAARPGAHRATIVFRNDATQFWSFVGTPNLPLELSSQSDSYVFDVDPSIRAARLTGAIAAEHGLRALSAGPAFLTGGTAINSDGLACFHVEGALPFRVKLIADYLNKRGVGILEIKTRGIDVEPDRLRHRLNLRGDNAATLLITHIDHRPAAIVARRVF